MKRWVQWIIYLASGLVLAQQESVVHSSDGSLPQLSFGRMTCLRVMQGERTLSETTCVDFGESGTGVLDLRLSEGILKVPYRIDPVLGEIDYLIRLGKGWQVVVPPIIPPVPSTPVQDQPRATLQGSAETVAEQTQPVHRTDDPFSGNNPISEQVQPVHQAKPAQQKDNPSQNGPTVVHQGTSSSLVSYFFLRRYEDQWQIVYSLLAHTPIDTPARGIRLFLDGKPISGRLTRRTTSGPPGHLESNQAEYGWINLGPLKGKHLKLQWQLGKIHLEQEWRLP